MMQTPVSAITRFNGALYRRGTAPARQQRRMHIDATQTRNVEHRLRQQQTVSDNYHHIWL
jgi:hypothetical protein